jgi:hypothetical protein
MKLESKVIFMPSSVNNTVGLGSGAPAPRTSDSNLASMITAKELSSYTAESVSSAIARENYQTLNAISNSKVEELRKYIYKMASSWSTSHKMRIISEYGDSSLLGPSPNETQLNKQLAETLIINMKKEDLEILLKDIKIDERQVVRDVKEIRRERKKLAKKHKRSFGIGNFEEIAKRTEAARNPRDIRQFLKKYDKSFKIPKNVRKQFGKLKKELEQVLKEIFNVVELTGLAYEMKIEVPEKSSYKSIEKLIINKTLLYVSLISGKSKKMYGGAILRPEPFNKILQYTSYAYLTGDPSLSPDAVKELRAKAVKAKKMINEGFRRKESKSKEGTMKKVFASPFRGVKKILRTGGQVVGGVAGAALGTVTGALTGDFDVTNRLIEGARTGSRVGEKLSSSKAYRDGAEQRSAFKKAKKHKLSKPIEARRAELIEKDRLELLELADSLNLKPRKDSKINILINEILAQWEIAHKKEKKAKKDLTKFERRGKLGKARNKKEEIASLKSTIDMGKKKKEKTNKVTVENMGMLKLGIASKDNVRYHKNLLVMPSLIADMITIDEAKELDYSDKALPVFSTDHIENSGMIKLSNASDGLSDDHYVMPVFVTNQISGNQTSEENKDNSEKEKIDNVPDKTIKLNFNPDDLVISQPDYVMPDYVMPDYVMNQISGKASEENKDIPKTKSNKVSRESFGDLLSRIDNMSEEEVRGNKDLQEMGKLIKSLNDPAPKLNAKEREDISKFGLDLSRNTDTDTYDYDDPSGPFSGLSEKDPFVAKVDNTLQATQVKGAMAIRVFDQGAIIAQQMAEKVEKRKNSRLKNTKSKNYLSDEATAFGIKMVKKEPASPVYVVNAMQDVTTRTDLKMDKLEKLAQKVAKLAINAALPGIGPIVTSVLGLATGGKGRASKSSAIPKFAEGTNSNARSTSMAQAMPMSQFIAGDSLDGKPNEEQVNIDWSKKEFQVKPVPSIDRQSLANSGISQTAKMGQLEKKAPMAVGITTQLASYTRDLKYVKDQGTKEAIKVMPVTPGIDDMVEFDGQQVSLIGLVAQMNLQLDSIRGLLQAGNQQRNAVISTTTAISQNTATSNSGKSNPFLEGGFPKNLDSILQGQ